MSESSVAFLKKHVFKRLLIIILVIFMLSISSYSQNVDVDALINQKALQSTIESYYRRELRRENLKLKTVEFCISPNYIYRNPNIYRKEFPDRNDTFFQLWQKEIQSQIGKSIDCVSLINFCQMIKEGYSQGKFVIFFTKPYDNYIIMELYLTKMYFGDHCSNIVGAKRIQVLAQIDKEVPKILKIKKYQRVNRCRAN